jgi:uncharacterized lipoprotein YmbA
MSKRQLSRGVPLTALAALLFLIGCETPPVHRLVTHLPTGRNYYTYDDEIEQLGTAGKIRFPDYSRDARITLETRNVQVEEISKVRFDQAVTDIAP